MFLDLVINYKFFSLIGVCFLDTIIAILILMIPITLVNEIIHGIVYIIFGGKIKFGFKWIYAYTQEISGLILHRTKFVAILLAPVTIILLSTLLTKNSLGSLIFLLNFLGSIGDIIMAIYICKSKENSYIKDSEYGFEVIDK